MEDNLEGRLIYKEIRQVIRAVAREALMECEYPLI
jgi:hypothetical protein